MSQLQSLLLIGAVAGAGVGGFSAFGYGAQNAIRSRTGSASVSNPVSPSGDAAPGLGSRAQAMLSTFRHFANPSQTPIYGMQRLGSAADEADQHIKGVVILAQQLPETNGFYRSGRNTLFIGEDSEELTARVARAVEKYAIPNSSRPKKAVLRTFDVSQLEPQQAALLFSPFFDHRGPQVFLFNRLDEASAETRASLNKALIDFQRSEAGPDSVMFGTTKYPGLIGEALQVHFEQKLPFDASYPRAMLALHERALSSFDSVSDYFSQSAQEALRAGMESGERTFLFVDEGNNGSEEIIRAFGKHLTGKQLHYTSENLSPGPDIEPEMKKKVLTQIAEATPDKPAVIFIKHGISTDYAESLSVKEILRAARRNPSAYVLANATNASGSEHFQRTIEIGRPTAAFRGAVLVRSLNRELAEGVSLSEFARSKLEGWSVEEIEGFALRVSGLPPRQLVTNESLEQVRKSVKPLD